MAVFGARRQRGDDEPDGVLKPERRCSICRAMPRWSWARKVCCSRREPFVSNWINKILVSCDSNLFLIGGQYDDARQQREGGGMDSPESGQ